LASAAQVQKDVRIEKRVFVIKDGKMLEQPGDSVLKELRINVDSIVKGQRINLDLEAIPDGNVMVFNALNSGPAMLGVRIGHVDGVNGVTVQSVEPVSTAAALGLSVGDVIYRVNNQSISEPENLVSLIRNLDQGARVDIYLPPRWFEKACAGLLDSGARRASRSLSGQVRVPCVLSLIRRASSSVHTGVLLRSFYLVHITMFKHIFAV